MEPGLHLIAPKNADWDPIRWPSFRPWELACRCLVTGPTFCKGEYWHDAEFLDALQRLRDRAGRALTITSGHRCAERNKHVKGAAESQHLTIAVDIAIKNHDRHRLLALAKEEGFTGTGLAATFLHLDRREHPAQWDYGQAARELWGLA